MTDVSPLIPLTMPCTRVEIICGTACFTVAAAPDELEESTPALVIQLWSLSTPAVASAESSALWPVMPATTRMTMTTTTAATASSTSAAASQRGIWRSSMRTTGIATTETMSAQTIGPVIVSVAAISQITPPTSASTPTSSHALRPRSRSQRGVSNAPLSWARPVLSSPGDRSCSCPPQSRSGAGRRYLIPPG